MGQESLPVPGYTEGTEISTCPTGLTPSLGPWLQERLKQDVHVSHHKGNFKATKGMLHRIVWFWEFASPPVPWCHSRLLLSRLPAALGTSMSASFSTSRTAPGAPSSSLKTREGQYMKRTMLNPVTSVHVFSGDQITGKECQHIGSQSRWFLIETENFGGSCQCAVCEVQLLRRDKLHLTWPFLLENWLSLMDAVSEERHLRHYQVRGPCWITTDTCISAPKSLNSLQGYFASASTFDTIIRLFIITAK